MPNDIYACNQMGTVAINQEASRPGSFIRSAHSARWRLSTISKGKHKIKGEQKMNHMNDRYMHIFISAAMIALVIFTGYGLSQAENADGSKAVFFVG
jgi:cytochrome b561